MNTKELAERLDKIVRDNGGAMAEWRAKQGRVRALLDEAVSLGLELITPWESDDEAPVVLDGVQAKGHPGTAPRDMAFETFRQWVNEHLPHPHATQERS